MAKLKIIWCYFSTLVLMLAAIFFGAWTTHATLAAVSNQAPIFLSSK